MKYWFAALLSTFLLVGCESDPNFWNPETCNRRLEGDAEDLEEYQEKFKETQERMEYFARSGDSERAAAHQQSAENWKRNMEQMLHFIDTELTDLCGKGVFRPELMEHVDAARKFLGGEGTVQSFHAEEMPSIRVTNIQSTFIPYEVDENGACSGPYINLTFTIMNQGGDFPRPIDLQTTEERMQKPLEQFATIVYTLDFGNGQKRYELLPVPRSSFANGVMPSGSSVEVSQKLRVENNQTQARLSAKIEGMAFLKVGENTTPYETDIDIPLWDIYTHSNTAFKTTNEKGQQIVKMKTDITNKGASPTPGPVRGIFTIKYADDGQSIVNWDGDTGAPVDPGGTAYIFGEKELQREWTETFVVQSLVYPLCPEGKPGSLSDGNTENNNRILRKQGE